MGELQRQLDEARASLQDREAQLVQLTEERQALADELGVLKGMGGGSVGGNAAAELAGGGVGGRASRGAWVGCCCWACDAGAAACTPPGERSNRICTCPQHRPLPLPPPCLPASSPEHQRQ